MKSVFKARVPVRLDFAGGTTDIFPFTHTHGGAVLNGAINRYVAGEIVRTNKSTHVEYTGNVPTSSGLGTSGAMNVLWLSLIHNLKDREELAKMAYRMEKSFGVIGGKQDHYAAAYGGINLWEFKKEKVFRKKVRVGKDLIEELENSLVLVYTGLVHTESHANKKMIDEIKRGRHVNNLSRIRDIAKEMKKALEKKDLLKFSRLMNKETENRVKLHKDVLPRRAKSLMDYGLNSGATAAKILGSGNGGSILFFGNKKKLKRKFRGKVINFKFDFEGIKFI